MDSSPIQHLSPAKKMKCSFWDYVQHLMMGWPDQWTQIPSAIPFPPKKWNAHFWITFNFWGSARLVNGFEPCPPPLSSQENEMFIFGLVSTSDNRHGWLMDSNPICHTSPAKKWNADFWITFNFWLSARLVNELEAHQSPLSSQKIEMFILMIGLAGQWIWTLSTTSLQPRKWNVHFWIRFNFWWSAGLVDGFKSHLLPLSR